MTEASLKQAPIPSDRDLILRFKDGDDNAFRFLFDHYFQMMYHLAFRMTANAQDAEEVAQDTFIRLFHAREKIDPESKLSTYLYRITTNLALNKIRDHKRKALFSMERLKEALSWDIASDNSKSPDKEVERLEQETLVQKALDELPEKQKTAILLRRYEELSYEEIAAVMHISISAVETLLFRARQSLRKKLKFFLD